MHGELVGNIYKRTEIIIKHNTFINMTLNILFKKIDKKLALKS